MKPRAKSPERLDAIGWHVKYMEARRAHGHAEASKDSKRSAVIADWLEGVGRRRWQIECGNFASLLVKPLQGTDCAGGGTEIFAGLTQWGGMPANQVVATWVRPGEARRSVATIVDCSRASTAYREQESLSARWG